MAADLFVSSRAEVAERLRSGDRLCRRLHWAVALGALHGADLAEWIANLKAAREKYTRMRDETRPKMGDALKLNPMEFHPLASSASNPWNKHRANEELRREIVQDVERTFPEDPFFREPSTSDALTEILFVYASSLPCPENANNAYRQGMNDIAAITYLVVVKDTYEGDDEERIELVGKEHNEADAFAVFNAVMSGILDLYEIKSPTAPSAADVGHSLGRRTANHSTVLRRCNSIFEGLLASVDSALFRHLKPKVVPQVFLLRWLRLLFAREYTLAQVPLVWDQLFLDASEKSSSGYAFADSVAVAMILARREELLRGDEMECLEKLMNYTAIIDARPILALAADPSVPAPVRSGPEDGPGSAPKASAPAPRPRMPQDPPRPVPKTPASGFRQALQRVYRRSDKGTRALPAIRWRRRHRLLAKMTRFSR
jgi:hypothetical protein